MGEPAEKRVGIRTLTDEELAALVRDAVANGVEEALKRAGVTAARAAESFTTKQAADILGITPGALRHHVSRGHLQPDSRGGKRGLRESRFTRATLDAFRRRTNGGKEGEE